MYHNALFITSQYSIMTMQASTSTNYSVGSYNNVIINSNFCLCYSWYEPQVWKEGHYGILVFKKLNKFKQAFLTEKTLFL